MNNGTWQSPTAVCDSTWGGSTWSLQKYMTIRLLAYTCISTKPENNCMGHLSPAMVHAPSIPWS